MLSAIQLLDLRFDFSIHFLHHGASDQSPRELPGGFPFPAVDRRITFVLVLRYNQPNTITQSKPGSGVGIAHEEVDIIARCGIHNKALQESSFIHKDDVEAYKSSIEGSLQRSNLRKPEPKVKAEKAQGRICKILTHCL